MISSTLNNDKHNLTIINLSARRKYPPFFLYYNEKENQYQKTFLPSITHTHIHNCIHYYFFWLKKNILLYTINVIALQLLQLQLNRFNLINIFTKQIFISENFRIFFIISTQHTYNTPQRRNENQVQECCVQILFDR